jgi:uncharacterized repeat protein (TIGR01451 family)
MKPTALSCLLLCGWSSFSQAGAGEWTNTGITGGRVIDVEYVGNGEALAMTASGLYRTTDHGAQWTLIRGMVSEYANIAVNSANPGQVLVSGERVLRSADRGTSFLSVNLNGAVSFEQHAAAFSRDGAYCWLVQMDGDVWRSADGGITWQSFPAALPPNNYWVVEADAADRNTVYAGAGMFMHVSRDAGATWSPLTSAGLSYQPRASRTTPGTLLTLNTTQGFVVGRSADYGASWAFASSPISLFRLATAADGLTLAGDYAANFYTSSDDGLSWSNRGRLPNATANKWSVDPANPQRILAATDGGIVGSDDGGNSWRELNAGLVDAGALDIVVANNGSNGLYVVSSDLASIYRRDLTTGIYSAVGRGSVPMLGYPGMPGYRLAVAPLQANTLYMLRQDRLGRSTDGGNSWTQLAQLPMSTFSLALDPQNPQIGYAIGSSGLLKTLDGGTTWMPTGTGLPDPSINSVARIYGDPQDSANLYALVISSGNLPSPVYKSVNGGFTWAPTAWTGASEFWPHSLAFEPGRPSTIYLAVEFGTFKSVDSGATWTQMTLGGSQDLIVDPQSPSILYAAHRYSGVGRSVDAGATWQELPMVAGASNFGFTKIALVPGHNAKLVGVRLHGGVYEQDVAPSLNLSLTPATLTAGSAGTFTMNIRNTGTLSATRVRVTAVFPTSAGSFGLQGSAGGCSVNLRELSCDIGTLAPAAEVSVIVALTPTGPGTTDFSLAAYENLAGGSVVSRQLAVQNAPAAPSGGGSGGGGGGRLDYLLLALLSSAWYRKTATRRR